VTAAILLWVLAWGYWAAEFWRITQRRAVKSQGHPQYFLAAVLAGFLFFACMGAHELALQVDWYRLLWVADGTTLLRLQSDGFEAQSVASLIAPAVLWAPILAIALPYLLNRPLVANPTLNNALARRLSRLDPLDELVIDANALELPLMVSLKNGKVYVGYPLVATDVVDSASQGSAQWMRIRPEMSGHRVGPTQEFVADTPYGQVVRAFTQASNDHWLPREAFDVVLPLAEVTSIHPMDNVAYSQFLLNKLEKAEHDNRVLEDLRSKLASLASRGKEFPARRQRWDRLRGSDGKSVIQYVCGALLVLVAITTPAAGLELGWAAGLLVIGGLLLFASSQESPMPST
jgi:hypothetical protein